MNLDSTGTTLLTGSDASRLNASSYTGLPKMVFETNETGNSEIFISDLDGSGAVNLTSNGGEDFDPVVSRDGSKIAFLSNRSGATRLYVMNSDGSGLTEISALAGMDGLGIALNADGSEIAFSAAPSGWPQIYVGSTNGTGVTNISNDLNSFDITPCFSNDGSKVLYSKDGELYTMSTTGTNKTFVFGSTSDIEFPSYTSDGTKIVFMREVNFAWDLFVVNTNGSSLVNLTQTPVDEFKVAGYIGQ